MRMPVGISVVSQLPRVALIRQWKRTSDLALGRSAVGGSEGFTESSSIRSGPLWRSDSETWGNSEKFRLLPARVKPTMITSSHFLLRNMKERGDQGH